MNRFMSRELTAPCPPNVAASAARKRRTEEHIDDLWPVRARQANVSDPRSSWLPLPKPYIVPGGRFHEVHCWDSSFPMLGVAESGRTAHME